MIYYTKYGLDDVRQTKKKMKKSKKEGIVYRVSFFFKRIKTTNLSPLAPAPRLVIVVVFLKIKQESNY